MLILLDIDGVMVPAKSWSTPQVLEDGFPIFSPKAVEALNTILLETKASIILTTSHRGRFSKEGWKEIFEKRGIQINSLDKLPDYGENLNRQEEIRKWFSTYDKIQNFVIIDDDKLLNGLPDYLKERLVLTKPLVGLTPLEVQDSLRILDKPLKKV